MAFEILDSKQARPEDSPHITLRPDGVIRLNKAAAEIFQQWNIDRVLIVWDRDKRILGLTPAPENDSRSYRVTVNHAGNMASIATKFLVRFIGWHAARSVKVPARRIHSMLQAELPAQYILQEPAMAQSSARGKRGGRDSRDFGGKFRGNSLPKGV